MTICAFCAPFASLSKLPKNAEIVGMTRDGGVHTPYKMPMLCSKRGRGREIHQTHALAGQQRLGIKQPNESKTKRGQQCVQQ